MRKSKTEEIRVIQSHNGNKWEDEAVYTREEYSHIKQDFDEYWASGYGPYRVITRRIKRED